MLGNVLKYLGGHAGQRRVVVADDAVELLLIRGDVSAERSESIESGCQLLLVLANVHQLR